MKITLKYQKVTKILQIWAFLWSNLGIVEKLKPGEHSNKIIQKNFDKTHEKSDK